MLAGLTQAFDAEGGGGQGREDGNSLGAKGERAGWLGGHGTLDGHRRVWSLRPDSLRSHDTPRGRRRQCRNQGTRYSSRGKGKIVTGGALWQAWVSKAGRLDGVPRLRVLMVVAEMGILLLVVKEGLGEKDRHLFVGG